jgi:hypothetical protein
MPKKMRTTATGMTTTQSRTHLAMVMKPMEEEQFEE